MKKKKDPVLEYIQSFDVFPARSGSAAGAELRRRFGNPWAEELLDAAVSLSEDREGPERFYSLKNRDLETSLFINLLLGGEVIRRGCAYFEEAVRRLLPHVQRHIYPLNCGVLYPTAAFAELKGKRAGLHVAVLLHIDRAEELKLLQQDPHAFAVQYGR